MGNSLIPSKSNASPGRNQQQATSGARAKRARPEADPTHQARVSSGSGASGDRLQSQDLTQDPTWNNNLTTSQTSYPAPNAHLGGIHPQSAQNNQIKQENNIFVR